MSRSKVPSSPPFPDLLIHKEADCPLAEPSRGSLLGGDMGRRGSLCPQEPPVRVWAFPKASEP